jgi:hypothetical protein
VRLGARTASRRIGLFWRGTMTDPKRIIRLQQLRGLWSAPDAQFFSLQKGAGEEEIRDFDKPLLPLGHELTDFADTAAVLQNLDLLITVDTAVAHLAGAMGVPVWTLIPFRPDWRWMLQRDDSPWYPTMRLYRQPRRHAWEPAIERLVADLHALAKTPKEVT